MEKLYENIENYLLGKLAKKERQSFEDRLGREADLQEEVDAFRIARDVVENNIADQLRSDFATWDKEETQVSQQEAKVVKMRPRRWRSIAIAASFALFLSAFMSWYTINTNNSNTLAMSTYEDMVALNSNRSANQAATALNAGKTAMAEKNYSKAIEQFKSITKDADAYADAQFNLASVYFLTDQLGEAHTALQPLLTSDNVITKEKAEWLQVLVLLKEGKKSTPEFQESLESIATDNDHTFSREALDLQEKLGHFWVKWVE